LDSEGCSWAFVVTGGQGGSTETFRRFRRSGWDGRVDDRHFSFLAGVDEALHGRHAAFVRGGGADGVPGLQCLEDALGADTSEKEALVEFVTVD
jgi:hypothetical protein